VIEGADSFGCFAVSCDGCSHQEEFDVDGEWSRLMDEMRSYGWINRKKEGEWVHLCPTCVEEEKTP
jgi:hypothetical protein